MKEKIKKFIILGFVLILILFLVIKVINFVEERNSYQYEIMGIQMKELDEIPNLKISGISNMSVITNVSSQKVAYAKSIEKIFEEELPRIYKEITSTNINVSEYYKNNQVSIREKFYNMGENNFVALIEKMKTMKSNFETDFDICDFSINEDQVTLDIVCTYKNGEIIGLNLSDTNYLTFIK